VVDLVAWFKTKGVEIGQIYVPGRHSQLEDFAASCLGVAIIVVPILWISSNARPCTSELRCTKEGSIVVGIARLVMFMH
jgi:hypothetical protein